MHIAPSVAKGVICTRMVFTNITKRVNIRETRKVISHEFLTENMFTENNQEISRTLIELNGRDTRGTELVTQD